jgi:hypothetical protein
VIQLALVGRREEGRPDPVEREDLLGERLVLCQVEGVGSRPGVRLAEEIEDAADSVSCVAPLRLNGWKEVSIRPRQAMATVPPSTT